MDLTRTLAAGTLKFDAALRHAIEFLAHLGTQVTQPAPFPLTPVHLNEPGIDGWNATKEQFRRVLGPSERTRDPIVSPPRLRQPPGFDLASSGGT